MQLEPYFERIGYTGPAEPTQDVLGSLLRAHALRVPFENLDVQLGRSTTTDPGAAYDKIVMRQRGGWCYEQNGLFGWVLSTIGFEVMRVSAAVMRADRGRIADDNHLTLLVRTAGDDVPQLVDVGFGGSMIAPIQLREGEYDQAPFRIGLRQLAASRWQFWEDAGDDEFSFDFAAEAADEAALDRKCRYLQSSPDSSFVQNLVAQVRLPDSHVTLRGKVLSRALPGGETKRLLESPDELVTTLRDVFGLDVPAIATLWPHIEQRHADVFGDDPSADTD
ncbi:MAG: arylamine N-acetyltransferase [Woeseiaceae bacterium]|nr:arylamine N-acetyltransferase [Woeseiaceae bacterium]